MSKINEMKPGKLGYKIYYQENTVVMSYKFSNEAGHRDTNAYNIIKGIRKDFPNMKEIVVSGRQKKTAAPNMRLTYANMEQYIRVYENAEELLSVFETVKAASVALASPYKYVCDWFKMQFPDYKKSVVFQDGAITSAPVDAPEMIEYKHKLPKAS